MELTTPAGLERWGGGRPGECNVFACFVHAFARPVTASNALLRTFVTRSLHDHLAKATPDAVQQGFQLMDALGAAAPAVFDALLRQLPQTSAAPALPETLLDRVLEHACRDEGQLSPLVALARVWPSYRHHGLLPPFYRAFDCAPDRGANPALVNRVDRATGHSMLWDAAATLVEETTGAPSRTRARAWTRALPVVFGASPDYIEPATGTTVRATFGSHPVVRAAWLDDHHLACRVLVCHGCRAVQAVSLADLVRPRVFTANLMDPDAALPIEAAAPYYDAIGLTYVQSAATPETLQDLEVWFYRGEDLQNLYTHTPADGPRLHPHTRAPLPEVLAIFLQARGLGRPLPLGLEWTPPTLNPYLARGSLRRPRIGLSLGQ